jgi:hypothetical protein
MNWSQLQTILWLRWRLSRNQWSRSGALNAVLSVLAVSACILLALGGCIGGIFAGIFGLAKAPPDIMLLVWDAVTGVFLVFWMIGIVTEIQRSESIDLARLLHLPVSLNEIFLINYFASHFTLSIILALPAMLGLAVGLAFGKGPEMLFLVPLALSFIFMITAWTYCLRGWLVSLMVNQRRRRAIVVGMTTGFILLAQLPNLYFNVMRERGPSRHKKTQSTQPGDAASDRPNRKGEMELPATFLAAHNYLPPLWLANGAMALAQGEKWPALWGSVGAFLIGGLGLRRAYRSTMRFYAGQPASKSARHSQQKVAQPAKRSSARNFLERELPGVPEEAAALALASFRSMMRAPEVKMALATSFIMLAVLGTMMFSRASSSTPEKLKPLIGTGAVVFVFFGMVQLIFNQFGFDRDGFRALVLLPARRKFILLGKNLAFLPIAAGGGLVILALLGFVVHLPAIVLIATVLQLAGAFLLVSILGNLASIMSPYRIAAGSLKPTKTPPKTSALIFVSHMFFPVAMFPLAVPAAVELLCRELGWLTFVPINLLLSLAIVAALVFLYQLSLDGLGELLERREQAILQIVTQEVE